MTVNEKIGLEEEVMAFAGKNFENPAVCRNPDQARFYSTELCQKIAEYENRFSYVPAKAHLLFEEYNARLNSWQRILSR